MMLAKDWTAYGLSVPPFHGALLVSGIYDVRPLVGTYINQALQLDALEANRMSPARLPMQACVPVAVLWGERETDEFKRQSVDFAMQVEGHDLLLAAQEVSGRNHFDIVFDLEDPASVLGTCLAQLFQKDSGR